MPPENDLPSTDDGEKDARRAHVLSTTARVSLTGLRLISADCSAKWQRPSACSNRNALESYNACRKGRRESSGRFRPALRWWVGSRFGIAIEVRREYRESCWPGPESSMGKKPCRLFPPRASSGSCHRAPAL